MSKPTWEMVVPVISTAHVPRKDFMVDLIDACIYASISTDATLFDMPGGCLFFFLQGEENWLPEWFLPIAKWMEKEYPGHSWVRFDQDGDAIEELPKYDW